MGFFDRIKKIGIFSGFSELNDDFYDELEEALILADAGVEATERDASERKNDFQCIECGMTAQEAAQESARCLRCDHYGYGNFTGGRVEKW